METLLAHKPTQVDKWIDAATRGDGESWRMLFRQYYPRVFALCRRIARDHDHALSCAQETFLTAYRKIATLTTPDGFETWLLAIAYRTASSHARRENLRRHAPEADMLMDNTTDALDQLIAVEDAQAVTHALARLDGGQQLILKLYYYDEQPYEAIAQIMQIETGTVKSRLHRAKQELLRHMQ